MAEVEYLPREEVEAEVGFWQKVDAFKAKAAEFIDLYRSLEARASVAAKDPQTQRDYNKLMNAGDFLKGKIESVTAAIDWASNMIDRVGGIFNFSMEGLPQPNQLGIAPLVLVGVVATITGGITLMTSWVTDAYSMNKRLEVLKSVEDLIAQGVPRDEAVQLARDALREETSTLDTVATIVMWAVIGGVGWWLYSQFGGRRA